LDKAPGIGGHNRKALPDVGKGLKSQALKAAGISTSEARRSALTRISAGQVNQVLASWRAAIRQTGNGLAEESPFQKINPVTFYSIGLIRYGVFS
jgi:hypothetical protein